MNAVSEIPFDGRQEKSSWILPSSLPDELVHGYWGRVQAVNCIASAQTALRDVIAELPQALRDRRTALRITAIAHAARMPLDAFCRQHTLIPFTRMATRGGPGQTLGAPETLVLVEQSAFVLPYSQKMVCPECIDEDRQFWGLSYWRRRHQLLGVAWCDKHRVALCPVEQSFDECPVMPSVTGDAEIQTWMANPVIQRYVEIAHGLLECHVLMSIPEAITKLGQRAQEKGLRLSQKGQRPLLSDMAVEQVPMSWLSRYFSHMALKRMGCRFQVIDGALFKQSSPQSLVLALALMFDSSEEALQYWREPLVDATYTDDKECVRQEFWNSRKALNLYVKYKGNRMQMAKALSTYSSQVSIGMDKAGMPSLHRLPLETTGAALLDFFDGVSLVQACSRHGADVEVCERLIRQSGSRFAEALRRIMQEHVAPGHEH